MSDDDRQLEPPSSAASLEIEAEQPKLKVALPAKDAADLLPLTGIVGCAVGPALTFWAAHAAAPANWVLLTVAAIQVCGIIALGVRIRAPK